MNMQMTALVVGQENGVVLGGDSVVGGWGVVVEEAAPCWI